jgi:hypothetical protein
MMRASWEGALLVAVASAGVAWGQPVLQPAGGAQARERTVTIQEKAGLPEPCRVLKTWTTAEGRSAYLLQSLDTDEKLTVVQKGNAKGSTGQVGASIYRWGNRKVPPDGSPIPPPDGSIRQVVHTTEAAPPRRLGDLPRVTPVSVTADVSCASPAPVVAHAPRCATDNCDKAGCKYVHHYEKPATIYFLPGKCVPVCPPDHAPNYGYYPPQWHAWPGGAETLPGEVAPERAPAAMPSAALER